MTSPKSQNQFDGFSYRKITDFGSSVVGADLRFSKLQGSVVFSETDEHFELGLSSKYTSTKIAKNPENPVHVRGRSESKLIITP